MSERVIEDIRQRQGRADCFNEHFPAYGPCSACGDGDTNLEYHNHEPRKIRVTMNLDHLRQRMTEFIREVSPDDPTAYTIPFETYLQWELRQRQEKMNAQTTQ